MSAARRKQAPPPIQRGERVRAAIEPNQPAAWRGLAGKVGVVTAIPRQPPFDRAAFLPDGAERATWLPVGCLERIDQP